MLTPIIKNIMIIYTVKTFNLMGLELRNTERRFINIIIVGIIFFVVGIATIFTREPKVYIPLLSIGLFAIVIAIVFFIINREKNKDLRKVPLERIDRESEDDDNIDELSARANEWFSNKTQEIEDEAYTYLFTETRNPPKKAICMISRTTFEDKEDALQCPNCENYFQKKYLLEWLNKNTNCPICQTKLKIKKI